MTTTDKPRWKRISGRNAPNFNLQSATSGVMISLDELTSSHRLVIAFVPGVWAPWCRKFLDELELGFANQTRPGVRCIAIVSQNYEQLFKYVKKQKLDLEILSDPNGVISKRYGVFDEQMEEPMKISKPSVFVAGKQGKLLYNFTGRHLMDRPLSSEIWEKVDEKLPEDIVYKRHFLFFRKPVYATA